MRYTIFGASGFIGRHLARRLADQGHEVLTPGRDELDDPFWMAGTELGHAVYAIGLTADFRDRPLATADAHVGRLAEILSRGAFRSFLYLSSTRIYGTGPTHEEGAVSVRPLDPDHLYNATKIAGEALVLSSGRREARVARLSNVYGPDLTSRNFLSCVLRDAARGAVRFATGPASSKDYIALDDATMLLARIAADGRQRLYNVASGEAVTHEDLARELRAMSGCCIEWAPRAPTIALPAIDTERLRADFDTRPRRLLDDLPALFTAFKQEALAA